MFRLDLLVDFQLQWGKIENVICSSRSGLLLLGSDNFILRLYTLLATPPHPPQPIRFILTLPPHTTPPHLFAYSWPPTHPPTHLFSLYLPLPTCCAGFHLGIIGVTDENVFWGEQGRQRRKLRSGMPPRRAQKVENEFTDALYGRFGWKFVMLTWLRLVFGPWAPNEPIKKQ